MWQNKTLRIATRRRCGGRDSSRRVHRRSNPGIYGAQGRFAGTGTFSERGHREGPPDSRAKRRRPNRYHAEPEAHVEGQGPRPAHPRSRHPVRARLDREKPLQPQH